MLKNKPYKHQQNILTLKLGIQTHQILTNDDEVSISSDFCILLAVFVFGIWLIQWIDKKFIYAEKATKFCEISTSLLSHVAPVKSKVEISYNFVAFSDISILLLFHATFICKLGFPRRADGLSSTFQKNLKKN